MEKPLSLRIKNLISTGNYSEAYDLATSAIDRYPKIRVYKELLRECEAKLPQEASLDVDKRVISNSTAERRNTDLETLDYHLRKQLDKVRAKEVGPTQAWENISFLAPPHWPKDPRLTRLVAPTEQALRTHFNQTNSGTLILTGDIKGGAGIAALRVFKCLNNIDNATDILYRDGKGLVMRRADESIVEIETHDITQSLYSGIDYQLIEELRDHINNEVHQAMAQKALGSNTFLFHSEESIDVKDILPLYSSINIHWCDFLLTAIGLERVKESTIPITITLHDMYWLSGSCHYSAGCNQFMNGCTACPLVRSASEPIKYFNSYHRGILEGVRDLSVISPSKWLCELTSHSIALSKKELYYIPNPQHDKAGKPTKPTRLHNSDTTVTIVYGALGLEEKRKGYGVFIKLIKELFRRQASVRFKVFGSVTPDQEIELQQYCCEVLGFLSHSELKTQFRISQAMLVLSYEDNYPNLCVEAAAVGLPVIASNNSGLESFIESSEGGVLTSNDPIEIANTIQSLSIHDMDRLGDKIASWYTQIYSSDTLERAYQAVVCRSDYRKKFLYKNEDPSLGQKQDISSGTTLKCAYIKNVSEFAVEILVPQGEYDNNTYSLSYSLRQPALPLDVYIEGYAYESPATLNYDGVTYTIERLPTGKVIKLISHDPISMYYYKKLNLINVSTYSSTLKIDIDNNRKINSATSSSKIDSGFILCNDSLTIEFFQGVSVYWLLAHKSYSLHFFEIPPEAFHASLSYKEMTLISFIGINLRLDPLRGVRLELNIDNEVFYFEPIVTDYSFSFLLATNMLRQMSSASLVTGAGEVLDDGREVIGLIKEHTIAAQ